MDELASKPDCRSDHDIAMNNIKSACPEAVQCMATECCTEYTGPVGYIE